MLLRERPLAPAVLLTVPSPLPSLRDALARRASIFGPVEADAPPAAVLGPWQAIGAVARRIIEALAPPR